MLLICKHYLLLSIFYHLSGHFQIVSFHIIFILQCNVNWISRKSAIYLPGLNVFVVVWFEHPFWFVFLYICFDITFCNWCSICVWMYISSLFIMALSQGTNTFLHQDIIYLHTQAPDPILLFWFQFKCCKVIFWL